MNVVAMAITTEEPNDSRGNARIVVDPEVAACFAELARGILTGITFQPDGMVEFEIDAEVERELRSRMQPGEDLADAVRRVLEQALSRKIPRWGDAR